MVIYKCDNCLESTFGGDEVLRVTIEGNDDGKLIEECHHYCVPCAKKIFPGLK